MDKNVERGFASQWMTGFLVFQTMDFLQTGTSLGEYDELSCREEGRLESRRGGVRGRYG